MIKPIIMFTDGSSKGNPGPGGWGVVLRCGTEHYKELSGGEPYTTNNRMELKAVIEGLKAIKRKEAEVHVFSDSSYVVNAVEKKWLNSWMLKGFNGKKNEDLWREFYDIFRRHNVTFHWIKGHAGHPENERCDEMAVAEASKFC